MELLSLEQFLISQFKIFSKIELLLLQMPTRDLPPEILPLISKKRTSIIALKKEKDPNDQPVSSINTFQYYYDIKNIINSISIYLSLNNIYLNSMSSHFSLRQFCIVSEKDNVTIREVSKKEFFSGKGIYRQAFVPNDISEHPKQGMVYKDTFKINVSGIKDQVSGFKTRRLSEFYINEDEPLFPKGSGTSFINEMEFYPTFVTECGLIDKKFLRSLFFTQRMNKNGYYKYFVMREGQYFVETVDDEIPVDDIHHQPIWGLNILYPYQIILLKAWIKEKKGLKNVMNARPFQFLNAFGFPSYKVFNFKKEIQFIANEHISNEQKNKKLQNLRLYNDKYVIIGQTRTSQKINSLGLSSNRAGYLITPIEKVNNQCQIFRVSAQIPCKWVGEMSVIADSSINSKYNPSLHHLDLQRSFLIKRKDLLELFNKYYLAPRNTILDESSTNLSINLSSIKSQQIVIKVVKGGRLNIKIEMPSSQETMINGKSRYPKLKYFLSRKINKGINKFPSKPQLKSRLDINQQSYEHSEAEKYQNFDIQYSHGCHKSVNQFIGVDQGQYVMHLKVEKGHKFDYNVFFSTSAQIEEIKPAEFTQQQKYELFQSTFYSIGVAYKTEVNITQEKNQENESIRIGNFFQQLGYGFISVTTKVEAKHHVAMRIFPIKLKEAGYMIKCGRYKKEKEHKGLQIPLVFISQKGYPEVVVFRTIKNIPLSARFPPSGTVEFYRITQNDK